MSLYAPTLLRASRTAVPSVRPPNAHAYARTFVSRVRVPRTGSFASKAGARPLTTSASVGFSLFGLFSFKPVTDLLGTSESSSIVREASPAAMTKQPYTLVFLSSSEWSGSRSAWQSWIMYFREQGYDCIDMNVEAPKEAAEGKTKEELLAEQITSQVRLSSLQRQPVLFVRDNADKTLPAYVGHGGLFNNTRGPMSGLIVLHPTDKEAVAKGDWPSGTPVLIIPASEKEAEAWQGAVPTRNAKVLGDAWSEKEGLIKEVENWMRYQGL